MTSLDRLQGAWRRSLITWPDGSRDDTTKVTWLQGPTCYADLRQPKTDTSFREVRCLRDLDIIQIEALAHQEGFAGLLVQHPDHFEWTRHIDFQPMQARADRGTLTDRGDVMIEEGYETPYLELWHRKSGPVAPAAALRLRDVDSGCFGMVVRVGHRFLYARARSEPLREGGRLIDCVRHAPSLEAARGVVDCELSEGSVYPDWRVERSTLPHRVSARLKVRAVGDLVITADVTSAGTKSDRIWAILSAEGSSFAAED